jgi:hypothetical protein
MAIFICSAIMTIIISSTYIFTDPGWINTICWILLSASSTLGINDFLRNGVMFNHLSNMRFNEMQEEYIEILRELESDVEKSSNIRKNIQNMIKDIEGQKKESNK